MRLSVLLLTPTLSYYHLSLLLFLFFAASGTSAQQFIQQALISDDMQGVVEDIEERHQGILRLESQVLEVYELFRDLAVLVDMQQEHLDVISNNILNAKAFTQKAEVDLVVAENYQKKARKRQCCIVILIIILIFGVLLMSGVFSGSDEEDKGA
jgi:t-SNARE complex subunit (syntaxin)